MKVKDFKKIFVVYIEREENIRFNKRKSFEDEEAFGLLHTSGACGEKFLNNVRIIK
jgi:hypothetical protein